jgi:hypothetical protein
MGSFTSVGCHKVHLPVKSGGQPLLQIITRRAQVDIRDANLGKAQGPAPIFDRSSQFSKLFRRVGHRGGYHWKARHERALAF